MQRGGFLALVSVSLAAIAFALVTARGSGGGGRGQALTPAIHGDRHVVDRLSQPQPLVAPHPQELWRQVK